MQNLILDCLSGKNDSRLRRLSPCMQALCASVSSLPGVSLEEFCLNESSLLRQRETHETQLAFLREDHTGYRQNQRRVAQQILVRNFAVDYFVSVSLAAVNLPNKALVVIGFRRIYTLDVTS